MRCQNRDQFQSKLTEAGVGTLIHYPIPPHLQQAYADRNFSSDGLPLASQLAEEVISLPVGPHLSEKNAEKSISVILHATS